MKVHLTEVSPGVMRVLKTSNVYTDDRKLLDEIIHTHSGVDFILAHDLHVLNARGSHYNRIVEIVEAAEDEYSSLVFLTAAELLQTTVEAIRGIANKHDLNFEIDRQWGVNRPLKVKFTRLISKAPTGNPYIDFNPYTELAASIEIHQPESRHFESSRAKALYLEQAAENVAQLVTERLNRESDSK